MYCVVTKLQEPNDHHHDEVQTLEQWLETNGFANIEDTFLCLSDLVDAPGTSLKKTTLFLVKISL